jgi:hypothetical protein
VLLCAARFDEAADALRRAVTLGFTGAVSDLAIAFAFGGKVDSAIVTLDQLFHADSLDPGSRAAYVWREVLAGNRAAAEREFAAMPRPSSQGYGSLELTLANLALGNRSAALDGLQQAADARSYFLVAFTSPGCDPLYASLRDEPRFKAIIQQIGHVMCTGSVPTPQPLNSRGRRSP